MEKEIFKDIKDYPMYQVTNMGRVWSKKSNKFLAQTIVRGYSKVGLFNEHGQKIFPVHRLVAMAFIDNPQNKPCVDHINTIRTDNRVENLRWVTTKENANNPITLQKTREVNIKKAKNMIGKVGRNRKRVLIKWNDGSEELFPSIEAASKATGRITVSLSKILHGKLSQDKRFSITFVEKDYDVPADIDEKAVTNHFANSGNPTRYLWQNSVTYVINERDDVVYKFLTRKDVASFLGVSPATASRMAFEERSMGIYRVKNSL